MRPSPPIYGLVGLATVVFILEVTVRYGWVSRWILPAPSEIGLAIWVMLTTGELTSAFLTTFGAIMVSVVLVAVCGLAIGYSHYRYPLFGKAYEGLLGSLFAVPLVLLFPVFLVMFGRNYVAIVAIAFIHCVLPVIIYTREGLLAVPTVLLKVGAAFRVSDRDRFWKIMLPQAAPMIFTGLRLAVIYVLVYVIGIEFLISFGGLGRLISDMYLRFEVPKTFAAISFVVIMSASFHFALRGVEIWLQHRR